jgi:hypothetical protein
MDTEPYARDRDTKIEESCKLSDTEVIKVSGHTLLNIEDLEKIGRLSNNMG